MIKFLYYSQRESNAHVLCATPLRTMGDEWNELKERIPKGLKILERPHTPLQNPAKELKDGI